MADLEEMCCFEKIAKYEKDVLSNLVAFREYEKYGCVGCFEKGTYKYCVVYTPISMIESVREYNEQC